MEKLTLGGYPVMGGHPGKYVSWLQDGHNEGYNLGYEPYERSHIQTRRQLPIILT